MVLSGGKLAGGNPKKKRVDNDFYATNPKAVEMLLEQESFECNNILEPCVGNGNIAVALKLHNPSAKILGVDIVDRGYPKTFVSDFLTLDIPLKFDTIITNPPFSLAKEFVEKSLTHLTNTGKCAMFLKIQFLEGSKRKEFFKKHPPKYIYMFLETGWLLGTMVILLTLKQVKHGLPQCATLGLCGRTVALQNL